MFSIITPTYNRQNELHRVYDSLKIQSYRNFQWIIIDDASTDSTDKLVEEWTKENNDFEIHYHKLKENGFADSNSNLDQATKMMRLVLPRILKAAEYENTILGLARGLEKTQRLINALEYVIMPDYQESIKFISSILEEREREDFARLKHVKKVIQSR